MKYLLIALGAMFFQQTFVALARSLPAVIAPAIITDLRIAPAWIGVYFGITAAASLVVQLGCGSFIVRYGAMRMSQIALVLLTIGTVVMIEGSPLALCDAGWPVMLIGLIACVLSATALSWHGVLLAEAARVAPEDMRGSITGGVLSFGQVGALALPLIYSGLLNVTGSYGIGFIICAIPALFVGVALLRLGKTAPP